jgi:transposase InsO family protein
LCNQTPEPFDEESEHFLCPLEEVLPAMTTELIRQKTKEDEELQQVMVAVKTGIWPRELASFKAFERELGVMNGIVVREDRAVLPLSLRGQAMVIAHRGHPGEVMMKRTLRERTWWPGLDKDVKDQLKECVGCTVVSSDDRPTPMQRTALPQKPWQEIAIDFLEVRECNTSFLVVVDYYSRYLVVKSVKPTSAAKAIEALEEIFQTWSYPRSIKADNGQPFASNEFSQYCTAKGIELIKTIPYWPQMNGEVERQNRGAVRALKIGKVEKAAWPKVMKDYVYAYNIRPHTVTDKAPLELMMGRPVKDLLPSLMSKYDQEDDELRIKDAVAKAKGKEDADRRRRATESNVQEGDTVFAKNQAPGGKLTPNFVPTPMTVIKRSGNDVVVRSNEGVNYRRCVTHLKKFEGSDEGTRKDKREVAAEDSLRPKRNSKPTDRLNL